MAKAVQFLSQQNSESTPKASPIRYPKQTNVTIAPSARLRLGGGWTELKGTKKQEILPSIGSNLGAGLYLSDYVNIQASWDFKAMMKASTNAKPNIYSHGLLANINFTIPLGTRFGLTPHGEIGGNSTPGSGFNFKSQGPFNFFNWGAGAAISVGRVSYDLISLGFYFSQATTELIDGPLKLNHFQIQFNIDFGKWFYGKG